MTPADPLREHPLRVLLEDAAAGRFPAPDGTVEIMAPPPDGTVEIMGPPPGRVEAVLGFTAHHVIAASVPADEIKSHLPSDHLSGPMSAPFLAWLATAVSAESGTLDLVLAAPAVAAAGSLDDLVAVRQVPPDSAHPRVRRAAAYRSQLRTWETWDGAGLLVVGRGLAGRWEAAFEVMPGSRGRGIGRGLAAVARRMVPPDEHVFVQVAPGNVASLRAVLAAGYRPIGAEVLLLRPDGT